MKLLLVGCWVLLAATTAGQWLRLALRLAPDATSSSTQVVPGMYLSNSINLLFFALMHIFLSGAIVVCCSAENARTEGWNTPASTKT